LPKRLWGDSIAGEGVTFHFYLPCERADVLTEIAPVQGVRSGLVMEET
jgi:hypothetical protein